MKTLSFRFSLWLLTLVIASSLSSSCSTSQAKNSQSPPELLPAISLSPVDFAYQAMLDAGINTDFANKIKSQYLKNHQSTEMRDQIVNLNVLGFLNPGDYSKHFSSSAIKHIKLFLKKYKTTLSGAEKNFQVPREIIASLLWVETRHGKTMGQFQLPVVYFSLLQANHPLVAKDTLAELGHRTPASNSSAAKLSALELQQKTIRRLNHKAQWALEQIKTLEQISNEQKGFLAKHKILSIHASFAGAFGCSQFIPDSYEKYAISSSPKKISNIFDLKDCIFSVANFLHKNGWDSQNPKSESDALFEYNRIRDYGDVIQKLAAAAHQT